MRKFPFIIIFYYFSALPSVIFQETFPGIQPSKPVTVRRTLPRILEYELDIRVIAQDGREEEGKRSGVVREVLTSFWNECFSSFTVGALEKVPNVRHDYQKGVW